LVVLACRLALKRYCGDQAGKLVVVLPDPFRGMGARRNSTETQQSGTPQGLV